ncbi:MAG: fumarate hydratase [Deltaproteobacteria bacterium]|nr:fumarate hydratase [Deltaproteobacteria bacterium]
MREIEFEKIVQSVRDLCISANTRLGEDVLRAISDAKRKEVSPAGLDVLEQIERNAKISSDTGLPLCQDTGFAVFFIDLGEDVSIAGGSLEDAVNRGVRSGYEGGYLRKSICDPFTRENTGDNTPAILHVNLVKGDKLKIVIAPKGGGSENMSRLAMLKPSEGREGVKRFVIETASLAGPNPCPPIILGVGVGGTFEKAALIAKRALLRPVGRPNKDLELAKLEKEILGEVNNLGIGPQGFGGITTALAVHIETHPCHIASLPVAVNIQCHSARHKEVEL